MLHPNTVHIELIGPEPSLVDTLKTLGNKVIEELPFVNYGGCCCYAAEVGEALQAMGIPVRGVVADGEVNSVAEARENGQTSFGHVLIEFEHDGKVYWHDARRTLEIVNGEYPGRYNIFSYFIEGRLTVDEMREFADNPKGWNPTFRRAEGIPIIAELVREFLPAHNVAA